MVGSPDPPPPYTVEQVFTKIEWKSPIFATREPDSDWLIAIELLGGWITQLAGQRKFVKPWTLDELSAELPKVARGRSFEAGKQAYKDLGCAECHRFEGGGGGAGPDFSSLVKKRQVQELLESIHEPSKQIAAGFETTIIQTISGRTLSGRIQQEDAECLVLVSNTTDALSEPVTILKTEIENRGLSSTAYHFWRR